MGKQNWGISEANYTSLLKDKSESNSFGKNTLGASSL